MNEIKPFARDTVRQVLVTLAAAWVIGHSPELRAWINRQWTGTP